MWNKLFGGGDGLPRERVDAVMRVVDRYLSEEAELRGLQTEKQTIHPRDLPPDKRRALIEEVFAILGESGKREPAAGTYAAGLERLSGEGGDRKK